MKILTQKNDKDEKKEVKVVKEKKIQKKKRIRWPKNFDFENPGPRPNEERWLPRHQKKKFKKGKKKNQG